MAEAVHDVPSEWTKRAYVDDAKYKAMYTPQEMERMCIEALEDMETGNYVDGDELLAELEAIHQRVSAGKRE